MSIVLADTGPLYALTDTRDQYHARAQREFAAMDERQEDLLLSYPVVLECYNLLYKRHTLDTAHTWLRFAFDDLMVNPLPDDYQEAAELLQTYKDQKLSLVDGVVAVLAEQLRVSVWTFDTHFDSLGTSVWRHYDR